MPRLLRGIFRKRRELLLDLAQCAAEAAAEYVRTRLGPDCRPGIVVSVATAGDLVPRNWPSCALAIQTAERPTGWPIWFCRNFGSHV